MWRYLLTACLLAASLEASIARADCALGASYKITVDANTVTVCPTSTIRRCGGTSIDLLRQSVEDGTVVIIGGACSNSCYVDTCVPPGTYHYGYATSYDCSEAGCGDISLFEDATVTGALPSNCSPPASTTSTTVAPPWGNGPPGTTYTKFKQCDSGCGCATESVDRKRVRLLDGFAVVVGLSLVVWRGRRHRRAARRSS
jgi:hypothetical protein